MSATTGKLLRRSVLIVFVGLISALAGCSGNVVGADDSGELVLVAGATGGTGTHVVQELLANGYRVRAFVRNMEPAKAKLGDNVEYAEGDVRQRESIDAALDGVSAIISAIGATQKDPDNAPEFVDYGGVRNLADAAAARNLKQIVLVSSAGVTDEDHVLNRMFNNVLIWKMRGENAVRESGVPYTIIRPGGLLNKPGGEQPVRMEQGDTGTGAIARADVARVCVAALKYPEAKNKTFELFGGKGEPGDDWQQLFGSLQSGS